MSIVPVAALSDYVGTIEVWDADKGSQKAGVGRDSGVWSPRQTWLFSLPLPEDSPGIRVGRQTAKPCLRAT